MLPGRCLLPDVEPPSLKHLLILPPLIPLHYSAEDAAECVEPLRSALWTEHGISLMLPPGSPPPKPAPGSLAEQMEREERDEWLRSNPADPEVAAAASHELAGSSPFSGQ